MVELFFPSKEESPLSVRAEYTPFVNFAMQQNAIPILRSLVVTNLSDRQMDHVAVRVWSDPPIMAEKTFRVDTVDPGVHYAFTELSMTILRGPLRKQSEREAGHLWIEVAADTLPSNRQPLPLSVLAYNEWFGVSSLPEMLAAHVLPNDPAVERILADASRVLLAQTRDGSLSGYQTGDPSRAYSQAAAVYFAAARQKISYINPPASFEKSGQKIRTPEHLLDRKLGTCMDTMALLAACFEQAGLRPVLVLVEGHAFVGVWLVDKSFDDIVTRHVSILLNRIDLGELVVVESTGITNMPPLSFSMAVDQAKNHLQTEGVFHFAVDVKPARKVGIRPLCLTEAVGTSVVEHLDIEDEAVPTGEDLTVPESIAEACIAGMSGFPPKPESGSDRLARWKTSLLDLTLRNRLLNFRESKKSIPLLCPDIAGLNNALAANAIFRVRPKPDAWGEGDPRDAALLRGQTGDDALTDYLREEMSQRRLHAAVTAQELADRLTEIERATRLGLEEGGANTLFLALGFLVWTEAASSDIERRAPILLIPMSIERKSVRDGFRIRGIDEETRINITLLQKLKTDFGIVIDGLDPLPEDDSGLDVPNILRIIRHAIKREPRWKVVEDACLTILTFSRFLMWLDLEANAEELKKNAVIRHLVETSSERFEPGASFPDLESLDDRYSPSMSFCPLHADSSQLRAVFAASEGNTFVLQGPPGTGKSQTIANLIAHCLTIGKRVLFVAQKRAALDVVHKRLTDVGLGPFCLELHSNKTTKESFRAQLRDALAVAGTGTSPGWEAETNRLAALRTALNTYVCDLHKPRAFGKSAYWIISRLIGRGNEPKIGLSDLGDPAGWTTEAFDRMRIAVREMAESVRIAGDIAAHPLHAVRLSTWTYGIEDDAGKAVLAAESAQESLSTAGLSILPDLGIEIGEASLADLKVAGELTLLLEAAPDVPEAILSDPDWQRIRSGLTEWIALGKGCAANRSQLLETYTDGVFALDIPGLIEKLHARKDAWFWKKWRLGVFVRKTVRRVRKDGQKPADLMALENELGRVLTVIEENARLDIRSQMFLRLLGANWQGLESRWEELQAILYWVDGFRDVLDRVPGVTLDAKMKIRKLWIHLATEGRALFVTGVTTTPQAQTFRVALQNFEDRRRHLDHLLFLDSHLAWGGDADVRMMEMARTTFRNIAANLHRLRDWSHYQMSRTNVVDHHLAEIAEALERGEIGVQQLENVFEHSFADWWARTVLKSVPSLAGFIGDRHDMKIRDFREHDARVADLIRKESFARIAGSMPRATVGGHTPASSEAGMLQRFVQGGRKTIRRIFKECPNALARYKPCVLMSPLSVAQFIGAEFPKFDLVVFDEASQMPTYDAIGAIARGNQLIVVGDSRQLPPTRFFERQKGDEDYSEDDLPEELESILEEAEAAGITPLRLDWHYRSRHESLISFSNRQYYENRLLTFPAAFSEHSRLGVRWREVPDAVYDHGKSRTNRKEAEAVVSEIVRRLRDPQEQNTSLGVVTFSQAQQGLVENLLDMARNEYPEIEPYFTTVSEPVFVKNLETVQGDERDVILFSICYGPDAAGIVRMNFGPLNNKGGERRLNVAITRARKQLLVFSRLRPDQIDISRTQATGVHHLRTFLDFARRGQAALMEEISRTTGEVESYFEQSVRDELTRRGWRVDAQVGCSGYRIDLAVCDPDIPGRYILGVECDGANYHSAKSARDRDRLRQAVLEGLGWRMYRVWSTDWWVQRPKEIAKLEAALDAARQSAAANDDMDLSPPANVSLAPPEAENTADPEANRQFARLAAIDDPKPIPVVAELPCQSIYRRHELGSQTFSGSIHSQANKRNVRKLVMAIAGAEAPLLFETLCSEVASAWGLQKVGTRVREAVRNAVKQNGLPVRRSGDREFIWTRALTGKPYDAFRIPEEMDFKARTVEEICPEEIANAAAQVLTQHISMGQDDLVRETAKIFGVSRLGNKLRSFFDEGIELLKNNGGCRVEGDNLVAIHPQDISVFSQRASEEHPTD